NYKPNHSKSSSNNHLKNSKNRNIAAKTIIIDNEKKSKIKTISSNVSTKRRNINNTLNNDSKKLRNVAAKTIIIDNEKKSKIQTINNSSTKRNGNLIKTQSHKSKNNLVIKRAKIQTAKKFNKLKTSKIGVFDELKSDDNTSNLMANSLYHNGIYAKKGLNTTKETVNSAIKTAKGTYKGTKKVVNLVSGKDTIKPKIILKRLGKVTLKNTAIGVKEVGKNSFNGMYNALNSNDSTSNLMGNSLYHNVEYAKKGISASKKVINTTRSVINTKNYIKRKVNRAVTLRNNKKGILTKRKKIIGKNKERIFTKVKLRNLGKQNLYKNKIKNKLTVLTKKFSKKFANGITKLIQDFMKNPKVAAIFFGIIILVISIATTSATAGIVQASSIIIPNIENQQEWITLMNSLDQEKNNQIHSGDKFELKNPNVNADWRDVISVCMAKYENDPPMGARNTQGSESTHTINQSSTQTTFKGSFSDIIQVASNKYNVDACLIAAIIKQESDFNPNETSGAGAMGLMQLMPETLAELGVNNPYDPYQNIMGGTKEISQLLKLYNGDMILALAGYNAGSGNVKKYGGVPPFKETQQYVIKVPAYYEAYKSGKPLPEGEITGVISNISENNFLGEIYNLFNTITTRTEKRTKTKHNSDGSTSHKTYTIKIVTLTRHDMEYVMKKLNFNQDQKEIARNMRKADLFKDVMPNFDLKFKLDIPQQAYNGHTVDMNTSSEEIQDITIETTNKTRKDLVNKALELVGKVQYFWGGKSPAGWNNAWGQDALVTASGSKTTGTIRPYGLDCSGFVAWVYDSAEVTNEFQKGGTELQWEKSYKISDDELQPGDLVFYSDLSHVGLFLGKENDQNTYIECGSHGVAISKNSKFTEFRRAYIEFGGNEE
ncbi:hypothetical protein FDF05_17245, partial [Clostridium botulinum]|nr:hypothetical protein [Clostridium botulinum]